MGTESIEDEPQHALAPTNEADDDDLVVDVRGPDPHRTSQKHAPEGYSAPEFSPFAPTTPPPEAGMMTMEAAVSAAAEIP
jgi:hypothetical protein